MIAQESVGRGKRRERTTGRGRIATRQQGATRGATGVPWLSREQLRADDTCTIEAQLRLRQLRLTSGTV